MEKYEIVEEFEWCIADITVYGRILKNIDTDITETYPYSWEISKYCSIEGEAEVYIPGVQLGRSEDDAEQNMQRYVERFKNYLKLKDNNYY